MRISKKATRSYKGPMIAAGAAVVMAIGGAGLYAGALATTTTGDVGAGAVKLQASCTAAATVTPKLAVWNAEEQKFQYETVVVAGTLTNCANHKANVNVYALEDGSVLSTNAAAHSITAGEVTAGSFEILLDTPVDADIVDTDYNYGLIIQTATAS